MLAVEHGAGDAVAPFTPVELGQCTLALGLVVDVGQRVHCLVDAAILSNGLSQPRRPVSNLESTHDDSGRYAAKLERTDQPHCCSNDAGDAIRSDPACPNQIMVSQKRKI